MNSTFVSMTNTSRFISSLTQYVHILTIVLLYVYTTVNENALEKVTTRVGLVMCRQKCLTESGCKALRFQPSRLHCEMLVKIPEERSALLVVVESVTELDKPPGMCSADNCSVGGHCIKTRSGKNACLQLKGDQESPLRKGCMRRNSRGLTIPNHQVCHQECLKYGTNYTKYDVVVDKCSVVEKQALTELQCSQLCKTETKVICKKEKFSNNRGKCCNICFNIWGNMAREGRIRTDSYSCVSFWDCK